MDIEVMRNAQKRCFTVQGACVDIDWLVLGMIQNNVYIISDGKGTLVVDPSDNAEHIIATLGNRKLDAIFCTHHHADHVGALKELRDKTGACVYASGIDARVIEHQPTGGSPLIAPSCPVDVKLKDKDVVKVGNMKWRVIATPGHTPGGICFMLNSEDGSYIERASVLVSGDTLFCGTIGRTDFEGGSITQMRSSLRRLAQLPDDTLVLPGHNSLTTIANERRHVFSYYC